MKRLNEIFDVFEDDIFARITSVTITDSDLASYLYFLRSSDKYIAPFFEQLYERYGKEELMSKLGAMYDAKYRDNLQRILIAVNEDYNPIHNVEEHTTETIDKTNTRTDNLTDTMTRDLDGTKSTTSTPGVTETQTYQAGISDERTRTPNLTHSVTEDERKQDDSIYAFNGGSDATPTDTSTETGSKTETETGTETEVTARSGEDVTTTRRTGEDETSESYEDNGTATTSRTGTVDDVGQDKLVRERKGNIGVTSTQQLLTSEFELRQKYNVLTLIFVWLDELLTIPIY